MLKDLRWYLIRSSATGPTRTWDRVQGNHAWDCEIQTLEPVAVCPDADCSTPSLTPSSVIPCVSLQCIVIGLQSTGEARTREVLDENDGHLNCFVSAAE